MSLFSEASADTAAGKSVNPLFPESTVVFPGPSVNDETETSFVFMDGCAGVDADAGAPSFRSKDVNPLSWSESRFSAS
jgi:hypothetical protein